MTMAYLALGSNVGDSNRYLERAIDLLGTSMGDLQVAPIYRSKAVGYTDQADFLNTTVCGQTELTAEALFNLIKDIEQSVGRIQRFPQGPREIDIDIIFFGKEIIKTHQLTIPHLAFREREFVLQPLVDLNPDLVDPVSGKTIRQLLSDLSSTNRSIVNK